MVKPLNMDQSCKTLLVIQIKSIGKPTRTKTKMKEKFKYLL